MAAARTAAAAAVPDEMVRSIKQRAIKLYNLECVSSRKRIYSPQLGHVCTQGCERYHFGKQFSVPVSICVNSWTVHICGERHCDRAEVDHSGGCYVCPLTQLCFSQVLEHHVTHSRSDPTKKNGLHHAPASLLARKKRSADGDSDGDDNPRDAKRGRPVLSPKNLDKVGRYDCIRRCLTLYLTDSPERKEIYRTQLVRFYREDLKMAKTMYRSQENVYISDVFLEIESHIAQMGKLLNPPSTQLSAQHIATIARSFNDYFGVIVAVAGRIGIELTSTERQIKIFTACMCDFLSEGFSISGTSIIDRDEWFAFHTPHVKTYGSFSSQQCRTMSKFVRQFKDICIAPETTSALYELKYTLPESFTSRWQRKPRVLSVSSPEDGSGGSSPAELTARKRIASVASGAAFAV